MSRYPFVSIVVPVRNREKQIHACLESLIGLDYPYHEIIVVDNHSTDASRSVIEKFPVQMVAMERVNQYAARNAGIQRAKGEIVAFIDSDCLARPDWLKNLVRHYEDASTAGVGGKLVSHRPANATEQFLSLGTLDFQTPQQGLIQKRKNRFMSGLAGSANISYRKGILDELHGFDEAYRTCGDYDLCRRVQQLNRRLVYEPAAVVQHQHRSDLPAMLSQFFWYGFGQALLFKKQNQGLSYLRVKSYIFDMIEREFVLKSGPVFINLDFVNFAFLFLLFAVLKPLFLKAGILLLAMALTGALAKSAGVAVKTKSAKWLILFPAFHLLRNFAFSLGRIVGAVRYRVFFS